MSSSKHPVAFWVIVVFLVCYLALLLLGQTTSLFAYDFAVRLGLQESVSAVSEYGVQVNRAFGMADTVVLVPLIVVSLIGLASRKRWVLTLLAAVMGITIYWPICWMGIPLFLEGVPGYRFVPGVGYWIALALPIIVASWILLYLVFRAERLT